MLVPVVQDLFAAGLAESTKEVYSTGGTRYSGQNLTLYPTSEEILLLFIRHLHREKLSHETMKSCLGAVHFEQINCGIGNSNIASMLKLEYVLRGAKKMQVSTW